MKRLAIYFFYDNDGIADRYIDYLLSDLCKNLERVVVVANGKLTPESKIMFSKYSDDILVRENVGLDVWAYKYALEYVGWENLKTYDEVVLLNNTIMGPVYPFSEMFDTMSPKNLDFWGLTMHLSLDDDPFDSNPYGYIPDHIQSSFMVFTNSLLNQNDLKDYWDNIPMIHTYDESIGKHESFFTKHFADMGYTWDVYVNNSEDRNFNPYLLLINPTLAMKKYRCPVFKRRSFFHHQEHFFSNSMAEQTPELYKFLKENTNYDLNLIWENIIRTCHQVDMVESLALIYNLSTSVADDHARELTKQTKTVLLMHLYFMDLLQDSVHYASAMPKEADIYITTHTQEKKVAIKQAFQGLPNKVNVIVIENRGRDVGSLIVGLAKIAQSYDLACFYHDKKTEQVIPQSVGQSFAYKIFESTLASKEFVQNVIATFCENEKLGLLSPLEPNHAHFGPMLGKGWGPNYDTTKKLANQMHLHVPMSKSKQPIAPLGTVFWFRVKALNKLLNFGWKYEDFPPEPNSYDGAILHAIERIYPFVAQSEGYYPAYIINNELAAIELKNMRHYISTINEVLINENIYASFHDNIYLLRGHFKHSNDLENKNIELHGEAQRLHNEIDRLHGEIGRLHGENGGLHGEIDRLHGEIGRLHGEIDRLHGEAHKLHVEIEKLIPQTSLKVQLRIRIKRITPKWLYGIIIKLKRLIFGPRNIDDSYNENEEEI